MPSSPKKPAPTHSSRPSLATSFNTTLSYDSTWDWKRYLAKADIEAQRNPPLSFASIRYIIFTIYRRLFSLVWFANVATFIVIMVRSREKLLAFVNAAGANLMVCGLARHPQVVNAIFRSICSIPRSTPLWLRRRAAKAYHYGGVHSGCGVAAFLWYAGLVVLISRQYWLIRDPGMTVPIVVLAYLLLVNLITIIVVAHPTFRVKRHDDFELIHRFSAWSAVVIFLVLLMIFSDQARREQGISLGRYLLSLPAFWFILVIIATIIHPWLLLRRVHVTPEYLSSHAVRLHLDHTTTAFGKVIALTKHPLTDWHSFATFPDDSHNKSFSCIVSRAGDWTARCIEQQPTQLWKRGVLMYGFIHVMRVFRRVIVVATGSGIGPCLSFLSEKDRPPMRLVWQTRNPNRTYGREVVDLVRQLDPDPLLIDTGNSGRVEMVPIIQELVREFDAEAVCVVSNPRLTKKVVFELEANRVPAFGPIFDS